MSIFKVKQWWTNQRLQNTESNDGIRNSNCLKVDKFNSHCDSFCIVVGEGSLLTIYKPNRGEDASHSLLETQLSNVILQIETGKFIAGSEDRQILVLHPQCYAIYQLQKKEGHTDAGDQNLLKPVINHSFTRKALNLTCGSFGNNKTRDFICIQALDGSLSFFDQDAFLFLYIFNDVIIPGPVAYITSSDSFVICKSTWVLEIHSYQQLREFSELNATHTRKNTPQWVYNAGEEISSVQVIQTSNNFSSIIALGERHLCCFQDNGLMKYMIKFDFMPICFFAYLIGWYYEPGARLLVMVTSEDSKLHVYEGTTLLWCCDLLHQAIAITRCFLKSLSGGLVTLSPNGIVSVSYLGTEPDLNANAAPMINDTTTPEQVQQELEATEETLQKILDGEDTDNQYPLLEEILKIKADAGKPVQNNLRQFTNDIDETIQFLRCPVIIILMCEDPKQIQNVQITCVCSFPFAFSESAICLDSINGTEIIETQVFLSSEADIPDTKVKILFTITDSAGKISVLTREVFLPISLYCFPTNVNTEHEVKLHIQTSYPCIDFNEIFTDFSKEDLSKFGNTKDKVTFLYRSTKKSVTLKAYSEHYTIEANNFSEITGVLGHFIMKLTDHFERMNMKNYKYKLKFEDEFTKQITHKFLKAIEIHAKERIQLKTLEDELSVLQSQFTLVQKRLLVQYGSLPPGDCDSLEFLMKDTHQRIIQSVHEILQCKEAVSRAGSTLTAVGHLIIYILKNTVTDDFKVKLIDEMLTLNSLYEHYQEWEEAVTQGLFYIMNNVFQKTEKDKEKLAAVTEQGVLSHINLKRFLKQIRIILDKMFSETTEFNLERGIQNKESKITRIEEFVEVI